VNEPPHLFRDYSERECGEDGYPIFWHRVSYVPGSDSETFPAVKDLVRANADHRCLRCHHPYTKGDGEWSLCDERCTHHDGEVEVYRDGYWLADDDPSNVTVRRAQWRILTVHHLLTGPAGKRNLQWWNLVALCQRCHLNVQSRVDLTVPWPWPHSEWFRPYAAGWYAWSYLGENLSREETMARLDELLALERRAEALFDADA